MKINSVMLNTQTDKISSSLQNRKNKTKNISTSVSKLFYVIINILKQQICFKVLTPGFHWDILFSVFQQLQKRKRGKLNYVPTIKDCLCNINNITKKEKKRGSLDNTEYMI